MKKRISVTIEEATYQRLTNYSASQAPRVSQSAIVDEAICEYIENKNTGENDGSEEKTGSKKAERKKA